MTATILTRDEERNLPRALTSLPHGLPVFVLDAGSDDRTVEHARSYGATVVEREWTDFVDARGFAFSQVTTPWALWLDADEALDDVLRESLATAADDVNGYIVRRTTYFCGKRLRMWSNEPLLRLFRTAEARIESNPAAGGDSALHERVVVDGRIGELPGTLLHYSYPSRESYRSKFERYTSIEAQGVRASILAAIGYTLMSPLRFVSNLLRRGALLDGPRGWYVAWWSAWYSAAVRWKAL